MHEREEKGMAMLQIGSESFREIRENNLCYVDKTGFIEEFLTSQFIKVALITRPRRFGKTLMMTMLRDFFDISQDSKALFEGLAISNNKILCDKWMNQYPVVLVTMKDVSGVNFKHAMERYSDLMGQICGNLSYLQESPKVRSREKKLLASLENNTNKRAVLEGSLITLCRALHAYWGKPVILLIDEYDVPLAKAQENGYYPDMVDFIRNILGPSLKTNDFLQLAILTGCLRVSKESLFSGLNNFACFGISEANFADKLGFTSMEVDALLADAGFSQKKDEIKKWYDGYRFGKDTEMYCPWDILQYISALQDDPNTVPEAYWENSTENTAIRSFIGRTDFGVSEEIEKLLLGGYVTSSINKELTYDTLYKTEDNLWTLLYLSGYLTKAEPKKVKSRGASSDSEKTHLIIPNKEIRTIFIKTIKSWFDDSMQAMDRKPLLDAFWNGDSKSFQEIFSDILLTTISYNDYHENFYHAVLTGLFIGSGYKAKSNDESGLGRADIIVKGPYKSKVAIIEVKHTKDLEKLPEKAEEALSQIKKKKYAATVKGYKKVIFWGISFCDKSCAAIAEDTKKLPL